MEIRDINGLTEQEFLEAYRKKNYPRPYLTADIVLFSDNMEHVLLVKRKGHPFLGYWALPGGFAKQDETVQETAERELWEETGVKANEETDMEAIGLFSKPGRDPRGWVVSEVYMAHIPKDTVTINAADDAADAGWFQIILTDKNDICLVKGDIHLSINQDRSDLAFDHGDILLSAIKKTLQ